MQLIMHNMAFVLNILTQKINNRKKLNLIFIIHLYYFYAIIKHC